MRNDQLRHLRRPPHRARGRRLRPDLANSISTNRVEGRTYFGLAMSYEIPLGSGGDRSVEMFGAIENLFDTEARDRAGRRRRRRLELSDQPGVSSTPSARASGRACGLRTEGCGPLRRYAAPPRKRGRTGRLNPPPFTGEVSRSGRRGPVLEPDAVAALERRASRAPRPGVAISRPSASSTWRTLAPARRSTSPARPCR